MHDSKVNIQRQAGYKRKRNQKEFQPAPAVWGTAGAAERGYGCVVSGGSPWGDGFVVPLAAAEGPPPAGPDAGRGGPGGVPGGGL